MCVYVCMCYCENVPLLCTICPVYVLKIGSKYFMSVLTTLMMHVDIKEGQKHLEVVWATISLKTKSGTVCGVLS